MYKVHRACYNRYIINNKKITKELSNPEVEIDPTGAGDAFSSVFISSYVKNNYVIDEKFIDTTFLKATNLTKKVVKKYINVIKKIEYCVKTKRKICTIHSTLSFCV